MSVNIPEKIAQPMNLSTIDRQYTENLKGAVTLNSIDQRMLDSQMPSIPQYNGYNQQYEQQFNNHQNRQGFGQPQNNVQAAQQQYRQINQNQFNGQGFNQTQQQFNQPQQQVNQQQQQFNQHQQQFNQHQQQFNQHQQQFNQQPLHNQQRAYTHQQANTPATQQIKNRPRVTGQIIQKGQRVPIQRQGQRVSAIDVCIGWDLGPRAIGYELDIEAFMLDGNERVIGDNWFVFYNQPNSPDNSVQIKATKYSEAGTGDDGIISVQLDRVNQAVQKIVFILTIDKAKQNKYNFSNINNAYLRIVDSATKVELLRFNLVDYYENVNSMMLLEVYRNKGEWKANAIGNGVSADLYDLCRRYGVDVTD